MSNFFFNYTNGNNPVSSNNGNYSSTIPQQYCNNGEPPTIQGGSAISCSELLYTIWNSYQSTAAAQFTYNQSLIQAPVNPTMIGPKNIFIIRHGEKNGYCLNNNGVYRASKLVEYVNQLASKGFPISYILTCNPCAYKTSDASMRPQQTISLSSFMLNIPFYIYGDDQGFTDLTNPLFNSGIFDGLNVLICWEHSSIQSLALNILNEAGLVGRLPASVMTAQSNPNLLGDEYFRQFSNLFKLCPDGNYLCTTTKPNYNSTYDPLINAPSYIGLNSKYYPYWNNYCFNNVLAFYADGPNSEFKCALFQSSIETCYANCDLKIGLYQPLNTSSCSHSNLYYSRNSNPVIENECKPPTDWVDP